MKSVTEIRNMIQNSGSYSPSNAALFEICEALLEHVEMLQKDVLGEAKRNERGCKATCGCSEHHPCLINATPLHDGSHLFSCGGRRKA